MKKISITVLVAFAIMAMVGTANAGPVAKMVNSFPVCDSNGNVTMGTMPAGTALVDIEIYDDVNGSRPDRIGPKTSFKLERGQGFNFLWKDDSGVHFQMITPQSSPPRGLSIDPSWIDPKTGQPACKYLFPLLK